MKSFALPPVPGVARKGFMFIELLIVLGVMGVLATIVIVAINPGKHLCMAQNAKRNLSMHEIKGAIDAYQARERHRATGDAVPVGEANAVPICAQGVTGDATCVNLDLLIPDYIVALPQDPAETNPNYSGYSIYRSAGGIELIRSDRLEVCQQG